MTSYANSSGKSGVSAYELYDNAIIIEFRHGVKYLYDHDIPGKEEVEEMKRLALSGSGLMTFINKHVRKRFAAKIS
jgi:hypothetical protein